MSELTDGLQQQQQFESTQQQQQQRGDVKPLDEFEAMKDFSLPTESRFKWCGCPRNVLSCKCDRNYNGE